MTDAPPPSLTLDMLRALRKLMEKATPGMWINNPVYDCVQSGPGSENLHAVVRYGNSPHNEANAELIVAMRNAIPAFLAVAERPAVTVQDAEWAKALFKEREAIAVKVEEMERDAIDAEKAMEMQDDEMMDARKRLMAEGVIPELVQTIPAEPRPAMTTTKPKAKRGEVFTYKDGSTIPIVRKPTKRGRKMVHMMGEKITIPNGNIVSVALGDDGRFHLKFINNEKKRPRFTRVSLSQHAAQALVYLLIKLVPLPARGRGRK